MPAVGILMSHVLFGVLGTLVAVALFFDVLNLSQANIKRVKQLCLVAVVLFVLSYLVGGYWYVVHYAPEKALILAGPWPWAHTYFMEVKEHLFFAMLMLSIYLPIAVYRNGPLTDRKKRNLVLGISALIVLFGLFMEGAGGIIGKGVTIGLGR